MFRPTALLVAGILVLGSTSVLAAQQATPPKKTEPQHHTMATTPADTGTPTHMWSAEQVKEAQMALTRLKLYDGKPTGTMNIDTEEALRQFQRSQKMAVTGKLSDSVLVLLRRESSMKSPTK